MSNTRTHNNKTVHKSDNYESQDSSELNTDTEVITLRKRSYDQFVTTAKTTTSRLYNLYGEKNAENEVKDEILSKIKKKSTQLEEKIKDKDNQITYLQNVIEENDKNKKYKNVNKMNDDVMNHLQVTNEKLKQITDKNKKNIRDRLYKQYNV
jgi:hypothetical protein